MGPEQKRAKKTSLPVTKDFSSLATAASSSAAVKTDLIMKHLEQETSPSDGARRCAIVANHDVEELSRRDMVTVRVLS